MKNVTATLTLEQWTKIVAAYHGKCAYCGTLECKLTIDHVVPIVKGGTHTADNIVPACLSCNSRKTDSDLPEALERLGVSYFRFQSRRRFAAVSARA